MRAHELREIPGGALRLFLVRRPAERTRPQPERVQSNSPWTLSRHAGAAAIGLHWSILLRKREAGGAAYYSALLCGAGHRHHPRCHATIGLRFFQDGNPCRTIRKNMNWSACALPQTSRNWRTMLTIVPWRRISWRAMCTAVRWRFISLGWQSYGLNVPKRARTATTTRKSIKRLCRDEALPFAFSFGIVPNRR